MTYFRIFIIQICFVIALPNFIYSSEKYPRVLNNKEAKIFNLSLKSGNEKKWARSLKGIENINSKEARKILIWRWLVSDDGLAKKEQLEDFYFSSKDWPKINKVKIKLENKKVAKDLRATMEWFQENPPVSPIAKIKLSELLVRNNFIDEGVWILKEAWVHNSFTYSEEKYILKNFKKFLNNEDHIKRLENLIWKKNWGSANRQLKRVPKDIKNLSLAKIKLSRRRGNVDLAIANVPKHLINLDSLVYERIKWRRRARLEKSSLDLLLSYKSDYSFPKKWWREINYHTRKQISYKNYDIAVNILKQYNASSRNYLSEAQWLTGWLSLTFQKDPKTAYEYFSKMFLEVKTPISKARASYWAGKSAKSIGDLNSLNIWFERASAFPATFYGQLALKELNKELYIPIQNNSINEKTFKDYKNKELVKVLVFL